MVLDPVVTSGGGMLRFEGFSSCCGVYARVDLAPEAFNTELRGKGTTNVDFNNPMRTALKRMRDRDDAALQVGGRGVALARGEETVIERKVKLPVRWIKGFCEVQAYQPRLVPQFELDRREAREFFRSLPPSSGSRRPAHLTKTGRAYRLAARPGRGSVRIEGTDRVRVLEPLIASAERVRVWYDADAEVSGWEIGFDVGRFFALVSPELNRGFSGEGQMLDRLAVGRWQEALPHVSDSLNWQSSIDAATISRDVQMAEHDVEAALAVLGARGLAGFDATTGRYFHRVLPFDLERVEQLQPRLKNARLLVEQVRIARRHGGAVDCYVPGSEFEHYVRLRPTGDKCTCRWFSRHQGGRGPCKHILAARLLVDGEESLRDMAAGLIEESQDAG
jgi:hypothetical protein